MYDTLIRADLFLDFVVFLLKFAAVLSIPPGFPSTPADPVMTSSAEEGVLHTSDNREVWQYDP